MQLYEECKSVLDATALDNSSEQERSSLNESSSRDQGQERFEDVVSQSPPTERQNAEVKVFSNLALMQRGLGRLSEAEANNILACI